MRVILILPFLYSTDKYLTSAGIQGITSLLFCTDVILRALSCILLIGTYLADGILQVIPKVVRRQSAIRAKYHDYTTILKSSQKILRNTQLRLPAVVLERYVNAVSIMHEEKDLDSTERRL